jgi:hypothetical protein
MVGARFVASATSGAIPSTPPRGEQQRDHTEIGNNTTVVGARYDSDHARHLSTLEPRQGAILVVLLRESLGKGPTPFKLADI